MALKIRFLEKPPLRPDGTVDFDKLQVGDLCYVHADGQPVTDEARLKKMHLTAHYFAHNASRPPLQLALPDHARPDGKLYFLVDGQCYSNKCARCGNKRKACKCTGVYTPKGHYDAWTVSGTPPAITVQPSVNYDDDDAEPPVKHYHGFIKAGAIGDG